MAAHWAHVAMSITTRPWQTKSMPYDDWNHAGLLQMPAKPADLYDWDMATAAAAAAQAVSGLAGGPLAHSTGAAKASKACLPTVRHPQGPDVRGLRNGSGHTASYSAGIPLAARHAPCRGACSLYRN